MIIERNEDVFSALKDMAGDIHLVSRNYNDELIGIHFYANLNVLTTKELTELTHLWHVKVQTCHKEKWASQWMVVQIFLLISAAEYIASLSGGVIVVTIAGLLGIIAMIAMIEDTRVAKAKCNLKDAIIVHQRLHDHLLHRQVTEKDSLNQATLSESSTQH
tara:strand:- start:648 stop:1130 length:483 start_codon:yes stop_codon:yes gene_type:complete